MRKIALALLIAPVLLMGCNSTVQKEEAAPAPEQPAAMEEAAPAPEAAMPAAEATVEATVAPAMEAAPQQ